MFEPLTTHNPKKTVAYALHRASDKELELAQIKSYADATLASVRKLKSYALLIVKKDNKLQTYVITSGKSEGRKLAENIAKANNAAESISEQNPLDEIKNLRSVYHLRFQKRGGVASSTKEISHKDVAQSLSSAMPDNSFIAINVRAKEDWIFKESNLYHLWFTDWINTVTQQDTSVERSSVVFDVQVGAENASDAKGILDAIPALLPGFRMPTRPAITKPPMRRLLPLLFTAGLFLLWQQFNLPTPTFILFAFIILCLFSALCLSEFILTLINLPVYSAYHIPPTRLTPAKKKKVEDTKDYKVDDYPLHKNTFMIAAYALVNTASPHGDKQSGEIATKKTSVPQVLQDKIGVLIGFSGDAPVHIPYDNKSRTDSVAVCGEAGSGKSVLVNDIIGYNLIQKSLKEDAHFPVAQNTIITFESKGSDGLTPIKDWCKETKQPLYIVDVANENSLGLDIFQVKGSIYEKATLFASALKYSLDEGAVQARAYKTLQQTISSGLCVNNWIANKSGIEKDHSPIYYASILAGNEGVSMAKRLFENIVAYNGKEPNAQITETIKNAKELYDLNDRDFRNRTESTANKLSLLATLEKAFWNKPKNRRLSWGAAIKNGINLSINTGTSENGVLLEKDLTEQISALLMYSLQHEIQVYCKGYKEQNKFVSIFADELSVLARSTSSIITWLRDQGRSFGITACFATQIPEQLSPELRRAFFGLNTFITFTNKDSGVADEISKTLDFTQEKWTPDDIKNLDKSTYQAVIRTSYGKTIDPVSFNTAGWTYRMDEFIDREGM